MTTKEVAELTGIGLSTITKYAREFKITHYGEGRRKIYDWSKADIEKLKKAVKQVGRPPAENPVRPRIMINGKYKDIKPETKKPAKPATKP
jgi:excisionase family DNA binding protein